MTREYGHGNSGRIHATDPVRKITMAMFCPRSISHQLTRHQSLSSPSTVLFRSTLFNPLLRAIPHTTPLIRMSPPRLSGSWGTPRSLSSRGDSLRSRSRGSSPRLGTTLPLSPPSQRTYNSRPFERSTPSGALLKDRIDQLLATCSRYPTPSTGIEDANFDTRETSTLIQDLVKCLTSISTNTYKQDEPKKNQKKSRDYVDPMDINTSRKSKDSEQQENYSFSYSHYGGSSAANSDTPSFKPTRRMSKGKSTAPGLVSRHRLNPNAVKNPASSAASKRSSLRSMAGSVRLQNVPTPRLNENDSTSVLERSWKKKKRASVIKLNIGDPVNDVAVVSINVVNTWEVSFIQ